MYSVKLKYQNSCKIHAFPHKQIAPRSRHSGNKRKELEKSISSRHQYRIFKGFLAILLIISSKYFKSTTLTITLHMYSNKNFL